MSNLTKSKYWLFFHIVFVYIVASFLWWSYLLHQNNYKNFDEFSARELNTFIYNGGRIGDFYSSELYKKFSADFHRKEYMLYGEGVVFITLITIGFWRIRKTFREEISLTRQQNNFLLSITHELKSPLASLKLSMQTLQKHQLQQHQVNHIADMSMDDIDRLELLVENILLASKIESPNFQINKDLIDLSSITKNIYERIKEKFDGQRSFDSDIDEDIYIHADRLSFSSVIYNLIENAIKYSTNGAAIKVILKGNEQFAQLSVSDTGIGIPENEKIKIFERFYRIGSEETRTTKGTGLGLFIVKQIVAFHDGTISVKNNTPKGSVFEVEVPTG